MCSIAAMLLMATLLFSRRIVDTHGKSMIFFFNLKFIRLVEHFFMEGLIFMSDQFLFTLMGCDSGFVALIPVKHHDFYFFFK